MIPDFPQIKQSYQRALALSLVNKVDEGSFLLKDAKKKTIFEGNKMGIIREDGTYDVIEMQSISASIEISNDEISSLSQEEIREKIISMANDLSNQISKQAFVTIDKAIESSGNIVNSGAELTPKNILAVMRKMPLTFKNDDRKQPALMSIYASPDMVNQLQDIQAKQSEEEVAEIERQFEVILDKKYEEYLLDLNSRKILDE